MKAIVIYYSKTGFAKRYAGWLSEQLECELVPVEQIKSLNLEGYDTVIFASRIYAGIIQKLDWFKSLNLPGVNKIVLATGATPAGSPEIETVIKNNFKGDLSCYKVFYLPGGLCYEKMGFADKLFMKMFSSMMKNKKDKDKLEQDMADALGSSFDISKKEYLEPVVQYIKER